MSPVIRKIKKLAKRIRIMRNWYSFIWPLGLFGRWPRTAKLRSGVNIQIEGFRSTDFAIFNEIAMDDVYGIDTYRNPKRIIDIGANIGIFSLIVAKKFPTATVFAIEPEQKNFKLLEQNIAASGVTNIVPVPKAVAARAGNTLLYLNPHNTGGHSLYGQGETEKVEAVVLADFMPADVLKIDAEGVEYEIFDQYVPDCAVIAMETHLGDDKKLREKLSPKYRVSTNGQIWFMERKT